MILKVCNPKTPPRKKLQRVYNKRQTTNYTQEEFVRKDLKSVQSSGENHWTDENKTNLYQNDTKRKKPHDLSHITSSHRHSGDSVMI